jgi:hypothetical protein
MSKAAKTSSDAAEKGTRIEAGDAEGMMRRIADELDGQLAVLTRTWRKQSAFELRMLADAWGK